jgi:hypothetical protein
MQAEFNRLQPPSVQSSVSAEAKETGTDNQQSTVNSEQTTDTGRQPPMREHQGIIPSSTARSATASFTSTVQPCARRGDRVWSSELAKPGSHTHTWSGPEQYPWEPQLACGDRNSHTNPHGYVSGTHNANCRGSYAMRGTAGITEQRACTTRRVNGDVHDSCASGHVARLPVLAHARRRRAHVTHSPTVRTAHAVSARGAHSASDSVTRQGVRVPTAAR